MREQVKQLAEQNTEKVMLLVPEQYSFESEKQCSSCFIQNK
ncbi:MAG: hypothetical protein ACLRRA_00775 [Acutalibacteraceae bacterium]